MKRARKLGEGWLIGAALLALLALSFILWLDRQPRTQSVVPVHSASLEEVERAGQVNLNAAGASELETLPGIGEVLAGRIIEYRERHGPFAAVEELLNVTGIGEGRLEGVRAYVRLD